MDGPTPDVKPLSEYLTYMTDVEGGGYFCVTLADVGRVWVGWDKDDNPSIFHEEPPGDTIYYQVNDDGTIGKLVMNDD